MSRSHDRTDDHPPPRPVGIHGLRTNDRGLLRSLGAMLWGAGVVLFLGILAAIVLFAVSGLWPPLVAVPSTSMSPNLQVGDVVFVMEEHRFASEYAHDGTGVVTYTRGEEVGYRTFGRPGDVIVFTPAESDRSLIIHRAMFYVNEGENWYETGRRVNRGALGGARNCRELSNCPAPHAGFITMGDNTQSYDQATGLSAPVRPSWIRGTGEFRVPWLGYVRFLTPGLAPATVAGGVPGLAGEPAAGA